MKLISQTLRVVQFEMNNYIKNKSFIVVTIIIMAVAAIGLSVPTILNSFDNSKEQEEIPLPGDETEVNKEVFLVYDSKGIISDYNYINKNYNMYQWEAAESREKLEEAVNNDSVKAGFVVTDATNYEYIVKNSSLTDEKGFLFTDILGHFYRSAYMKEHNINIDEVEQLYKTPILYQTTQLGKDGVASYFYCYILIFVVYMLILVYGQMIAVSVTSEKSNRAIEVLVTSTSSNSLIFGKVIAGMIASLAQAGLIISTALISYNVNKTAWIELLDFDMVIPVEVIITFTIFGLFGFLFYCFIYGCLGALVSKTEDVGKSVGPVMFIFMIGFFIGMISLTDSNTLLVKISSFIPFTSCYTMMVRVAMESVPIIEIIISFIILALSNVLVGVIGSKIYRMGTLHYGNPLKLSTVLKRLKKEKNA